MDIFTNEEKDFGRAHPATTVLIVGAGPAGLECARVALSRGHRVDRWGDWNELAGHAHGITLDPQSSMRAGGYDPRSDGAAIGY